MRRRLLKTFVAALAIAAANTLPAMGQTTYTLGDIPEGWTVTANGQSVEVTDGTATITEGADVELIPANPAKVKNVTLVDTPCETNEYLLGTWNSTTKKVVYTKQATDNPTEIANGYTGGITSGWYTVTGDNVNISGDITLSGDTHIILCDGAKLTVNGQIFGSYHNLYIYGQGAGTGKLIVSVSCDEVVMEAFNRLEIHGGVISTTSTSFSNGIVGANIAVFGGKLTASGNYGISANIGNNMDIYGGEVIAIGSGTTPHSMGVYGGSLLTVYGGKLTARCPNGSAIGGHIKSGTDAIKFYFADTEEGLATAVGTVYPTATATPNNHYAKAE